MLQEIFSPMRIKLNLESTTKNDVFEELVETITGSESEYNPRELVDAVSLRENKMNTIIMPGIAVPHGYSATVHGIIGAIGFSHSGIEYGMLDQNPVHLFFMLLMDQSSREQHLLVLSRLLALINSSDFNDMLKTETPSVVYELLRQY